MFLAAAICAAAFGIMLGKESFKFRRRTKHGLHNKRAEQAVDGGFQRLHLHRRVCGSDNVGVEVCGEPQHDAGSGERAVRDERVQEILPRRVRQPYRVACGELRSGGVVEGPSLGRGEVLAGMHCRHDGLRGVCVCSG